MSDFQTVRFLDEILNNMVSFSASDLYITVGSPAIFRVHDEFQKHSYRLVEANDIEEMIKQLLTPDQIKEFDTSLEYNTSIQWNETTRFRLNFFHQQKSKGIVFRTINTIIPTIMELGLPPIYADLILRKKGLILVSSPSGSGKSTSVAAMLGHRNINGSGHIITIEDPIEYIHQHKNCIFTQREIGVDTVSFELALKNALRQKADVVFIGEIRDRDTMDYAINFAETGHLCIATLHSNNSHQSIVRMLGFYPEEMQKSVAITLSQNIEAIISQKLVPNLAQSRSLAVEILLNVGLIKTLIADIKVNEIKEIMEKNQDIGMVTFDTSLFNMAKSNIISEVAALANAENPSQLKLRFTQTDANSFLNKALNTSVNKSKF